MRSWTPPESWQGKWQVLAVVELGVLLCSIDGTIVILALPSIATAFGQSIAAIQWVSVSYMLTCAATLTLAGKFADFLGRKKAYLAGFAIFTIASLASGLSSNLEWLVATRVFTACGTAFLLSSSNAILTAVFPKEQRGFVLGLGATVFSIGVAAGLSIGAAILHFASWRWVFLINFPVGVFALAAGAVVFNPVAVGAARPRTKRLDWGGSVLLLVCLLSLLLGLQALVEGETWLCAPLEAMALIAGYFLFRTERRAEDPMLPLWLFGVSEVLTGSITRIIMRMATSGVVFALPFYLQFNLGLSPSEAGFLLLPYVVVFAFGGPLAGHLADRGGSRPILLAGLACLGIGVALHLLLPGGKTAPGFGVIGWVILAQAVMGLGAALFGSPNTKAAMESVSREHHAVVSGVLWTTTFVGQSLGTALAAVLLSVATTETNAPLQNQRMVFGSLALLVAAAWGLSVWSSPTKGEVIAEAKGST